MINPDDSTLNTLYAHRTALTRDAIDIYHRALLTTAPGSQQAEQAESLYLAAIDSLNSLTRALIDLDQLTAAPARLEPAQPTYQEYIAILAQSDTP